MIKQSLALLALLALSSACASAREGYLYNDKSASKGSLVFQDARATRGNLVAMLADGERCTGSFNTIPDAVQMDDENRRVDREESQAGLAILECNDKHLVRCEFQRDHAGAGSGRCSDTSGEQFELYF